MPNEPTVFVVDDDELARASVCALVQSMGVRAESFCSAEEFLESYADDRPGCLVTDVRMLGMSGIELQQRLQELDIPLPVVVMTAHAKVPMTVRAMRAGAVTLLEKPCGENELWDAIRKALAQDTEHRDTDVRRRELRHRIDGLTPTQRSVMDHIVAGRSNRWIAQQLDLGLRTVETRRQNIFKQLQAESVAELVQLVIEADPKRRLLDSSSEDA